ncbi:hypothetical protein DFJ63DRAFT_342648 [Scheffersomyces coipomensis]|uniref:uncharacterized protein n=1 Tax=Scheffersomyces coipomensis TaxID=1788519 RepID=UPI00315C9793
MSSKDKMIGLTRQLARTSYRQYATTTATSSPKKIGAFRGGFVGFLLGVTATGAASYYYLLDQYKLANNTVVADIVALQASISKLEKHINSLDDSKK